jgi:hypothetical protein
MVYFIDILALLLLLAGLVGGLGVGSARRGAGTARLSRLLRDRVRGAQVRVGRGIGGAGACLFSSAGVDLLTGALGGLGLLAGGALLLAGGLGHVKVL